MTCRQSPVGHYRRISSARFGSKSKFVQRPTVGHMKGTVYFGVWLSHLEEAANEIINTGSVSKASF